MPGDWRVFGEALGRGGAMTFRSLIAIPILVVPLALAGCGGGMADGTPAAGSTSAATPDLITISGMAFTPTRLQVTPGATVTVRNMDSMPHSVTSETAMNDFHHGTMAGVSFDTGPFTGVMSFTIPPTATVGMVIPFFSSVDTSMMATPNGEIEIVPSTSMPMMPMMPMMMPAMPMPTMPKPMPEPMPMPGMPPRM